MKYPQLVSGRTVSGLGGWLSSELDSHGLDGRVYARLLLSLLHGPAQINATELLEAKAGEGKQARKRIRVLEQDRLCFATHCELWTSEQVKRHAAVECLKSASEQDSGIESLVDELCIKLREIENENSTDKETLQDESKSRDILIDDELYDDNPNRLADKYYAAFPALSGLNQVEKTISLYHRSAETSVWLTNSVEQQTSSSVQKHNRLNCNTYPTRTSTNKKNRKQYSKTSKMWKETSDMDRKLQQHGGKSARSRLDFGKKSKSRTRNRTTEQWDTVWEFGKEELLREYINNQCNSKDEGYDTPIKCDEKDLDEVCFNREWIIEYELNSQNCDRPETVVDEINMAKFEAKFNESVEALWNDDKQTDCCIDELNLPVDFQDLLSSPSDRMFEDVVDAQIKTGATTGRTLKNSIWSENLNEDETDCMLNEKSFYPRAGAASDEYKHQLELVRSCWENSDMELKNIRNNKEFSSMPWQSNYRAPKDVIQTSAKWSDVISQSFVNTPYRVLNHSKHSSSFSEVVPKANTPEWPTDKFGVIQKPYKSVYNNFPQAASTKEPDDKVEDDLLTSPKTHFRPIKDDGYADGATFAICSAIDRVNYKLCEDGLLAITSDVNSSKRYMIYKSGKSEDSQYSSGKGEEFILKFSVKQTSKSCQTDELMFDMVRTRSDVVREDTGKDCSAHLKNNSTEMDIFDKEIQQFGARKWCTKCSPTTTNNNNIWNSNWPLNKNTTTTATDLQHDDKIDPLLQIWSSHPPKPCDSCSTNSGPTSDIHELKSELRKDGEEILSDLSYMQSLYIGSEWEDDEEENISDQDIITQHETPFDVNKLISSFIKPDDMMNLLKTVGAGAGGGAGAGEVLEHVVQVKTIIDCPGRKRRHSSTTRNPKDASGECKKPHCKFSHEISSMPCQFWADNSCEPDGLCPYQHPSAYTRPLTR